MKESSEGSILKTQNIDDAIETSLYVSSVWLQMSIEIENKELFKTTFKHYEADLQYKANILEEMNILLNDRFNFDVMINGEDILDMQIDALREDITAALEFKKDELK